MTRGRRGSVALAAVIAAAASLLLASTAPRPHHPGVAVLASSPDPSTLTYTTVCNAVVDESGRAFTAAHCISDLPTPLWLHVGGTDRCSPADWQTASVVGTSTMTGRDLARLELDRPLTGTAPDSSSRHVRITHGFGDVLADTADTCRVSSIPLEGKGVGCSSSRWVLCLQGPGLCPGWSGAGVWGEGELVGIVSRGGCNETTLEVAALRKQP